MKATPITLKSWITTILTTNTKAGHAPAFFTYQTTKKPTVICKGFFTSEDGQIYFN